MAKGQVEETIIAHGVHIEGDFISQGDVLIEGEVVGSVKTDNDLRAGESSAIEASVFAKNAVIAGKVKGNITIAGKLELSATAQIEGDVQTDILSIASGAKVNGRISMGQPVKAQKASKEVQEDEA